MNIDYALSVAWWIKWREKNPVRDALTKAFRDHWLPIIEEKLNTNQACSQHPRNWSELAYALNRDQPTLWRWRSAKHRLSTSDILAISTVFSIPMGNLFPTSEEWIGNATWALCKGTLPKFQCKIYAIFVVKKNERKITNEDAINHIIKIHGFDLNHKHAEIAINRVAEYLEYAVLLPIENNPSVK